MKLKADPNKPAYNAMWIQKLLIRNDQTFPFSTPMKRLFMIHEWEGIFQENHSGFGV